MEKGKKTTPVTLASINQSAYLINISSGILISTIDVAFPVLHGQSGEDGTIQGLFKIVNVAFVGCDVMASSICIDKDFTKKVLKQADLKTVPYMVANDTCRPRFNEIVKRYGTPFFIKPASLGSSIGICRVETSAQYHKAIAEALQYDNKVLIEKNIKGREIECAVLGNEKPSASLPGEIKIKADFYDFETKYVNNEAVSLCIPADLTLQQRSKIREMAVSAFTALACSGLARVDFFLSSSGEIFVNEINTLPGFTDGSMYATMWEITGVSYSELIDRLIELAWKKFKKEEKRRKQLIK